MKKRVSKEEKLRRISNSLVGILFVKKGAFTISLTEEEIYTLLKDNKLQIKDGDSVCTIIE